MLSDKKITILNNTGVLPEGVLIDLCANNFVQAITFLRARCVQARYRALSLLSFAQLHLPLYDFLQLRLINSLQDFLAPVRSLQNGIYCSSNFCQSHSTGMQ